VNATFTQTYEISIDDQTVTEGGTAQFTVTLTPAVTANDSVSVTYVTADDTANAASGDYTAHPSSVLTFNPGESEKKIDVVTLDDSLVENQERFFVNLSNPSASATITDNQGEGYIDDADQYTLSIADAAAVTEGTQSSFTVTVSPAVQTGDTVTVQYSTLETGTAKAADGDFTAETNTVLTFSEGDSSKTATVNTLDEGVVEDQESFPVELSNPTASTGSVGIGTGTATGYIDDDDQYTLSIADAGAVTEGSQSSFTVTVSPTVQTGHTVTVQYSTLETGTAKAANGDFTAEANTVLTFNQGDSSKTATVTTLDEGVVEDQESFPVELSNPSSSPGNAVISTGTGTGYIDDNDQYTISVADAAAVTEGTQSSFTVTVSPAVQTGDTVTVNYSTSDGTAVEPGDYTAETNKTLTFAPGQSSKSATVATNSDPWIESQENFTVTLSDPTTTTGSVVIGTAAASGYINDAVPYYRVSIDDVSITEGNLGTKNATFLVRLNREVQEDDQVTVDFATADGSAQDQTGDNDYVSKIGTVTIQEESTSRTFTVTINGDKKVENDENFFVNLSNPVSQKGRNISFTDWQGEGTITNDDTFGVTVDDVAADEGNSLTFTITLGADTALDLDVTYDASDGTATVADNDYTDASGSVTFLAGSLAGATKQFTVNTTADTKVEADETFTVTVSSAHAAYNGVNDTGTGTINNEDTYGISIADASAVEGSPVTFTITLDEARFMDVDVSVATSDGTATLADSDYTETNGVVTIPAGAAGPYTFDVATTSDAKVENDETFTVTLSSTDPNANIGCGEWHSHLYRNCEPGRYCW
jgi:hypothetical protein